MRFRPYRLLRRRGIARTRTEELLGSYSLASRAATYLPMIGLWKSEVMVLCDAIAVPKEITDSSRHADPDCGRPLEMSEIPLELVDIFARRRELGGRMVRTLLTPQQHAYLSAAQERNGFRTGLPVRGRRVTVLRPDQMWRQAARAARRDD